MIIGEQKNHIFYNYIMVNLDKIKKVHIIGIKGSGVIAIVDILHSMGKIITGSDTHEKFFTDSILQRLDIKYFEEFSESNIPEGVDLVIYSTAYNENNNVEMRYAKDKGLLMMSYPEMLAYLFNKKYGIAVSGTHGKTTTSSMLACALKEAGVDPQAVIGSKVIDWGGSALLGKGEYFIAETDEYQNKLDLYEPKAAILTSCDWDHPDCFPSFFEYKEVFRRFVNKIPKAGFLVTWGDSTDTLDVSKNAICEVLTYGFGEDCDFQISNSKFKILSADRQVSNKTPNSNNQNSEPIQSFEIKYNDKSLGGFEIKLAGKHNILNAAAVIAVCHKLQFPIDKVREALKNFRGTARRFEFIGERNGAILIDDYAHHPEEIVATLKAVREIYPEKTVWAVFHPHTYTRTKALLQEFSQSFDSADKVIILDIYGSAREIQGGVHSQELVDLINKYDRGKADYIPTIDEAVEFLKDKIDSDDVVTALGAGNVWEVADKLKEK